MNPFTAAVAGGALTVGNRTPRRSTEGESRNGHCEGAITETMEQKSDCNKKSVDNGKEAKDEKHERECTIL